MIGHKRPKITYGEVLQDPRDSEIVMVIAPVHVSNGPSAARVFILANPATTPTFRDTIRSYLNEWKVLS